MINILEFSADWKQIDCQNKETLIIIKEFPLLEDMQLFNNKPLLVVQEISILNDVDFLNFAIISLCT